MRYIGHLLHEREIVLALNIGPRQPTIQTLSGEKPEAIKELQRSAADHLASGNWWYYAELEPSFAPLRKDARFQTMFAAIRQHAAAERAAVDRLRSSGDVPDRR